MSDWKNCISQQVGAERISDLNNYISREPHSSRSPIDEFYKETQSILGLFPLEANWHENDWAGALSSIAIISITENYFRQAFSQILKICTESQKSAASHSISLGSVIWHPSHEIERGAFENTSLASSDTIIKTSKNYIGIDLKKEGLGAILEEFDKICELRHGIVHSAKILAGKNGIKLKLQPHKNATKILIGFNEFQEAMSVCNALVVESNRIFFLELAKRWATSWRNSPKWDQENANAEFKKVWSIFHSARDSENGTIPNNLTWIQCKNKVVREYNL